MTQTAELLALLREAQDALEPYMRVIPGTRVLNAAGQVCLRISHHLHAHAVAQDRAAHPESPLDVTGAEEAPQ